MKRKWDILRIYKSDGTYALGDFFPSGVVFSIGSSETLVEIRGSEPVDGAVAPDDGARVG